MKPNDDIPDMYPIDDNELIGPELPSRRYICEGCGQKRRRSNSPELQAAPPVCPVCHDYILWFKRIEKMIPKIIYLKAKYPEL